MLEKIKKFLNHERYQAISVLIILCIAVWIFGCQSTVKSLLSPQVKVNRAQLQAELDSFITQAQIQFDDLDRQDEIRQTIIEHGLLIARTGVFNPIALIPVVAGILGTGVVVDRVREKKKKKKLEIDAK